MIFAPNWILREALVTLFRMRPKIDKVYPMTGAGTMWAGMVSTAGGLVFFGGDDGQLIGLDAKRGRHLWHFYMGQMLTASPVTFRVNSRQYVSIAAETDVFTFGLFEPAVSIPVVPEKR